MDVQSLVAQARDALSVERVFGTPYEKDGIAVVPVASVRAGGGGGGGPTGGGGGGVEARPAVACGLGAASSSCSYAAVALARSIFRKGANFTAAMAFEFASTNLVIELGIIVAILIGWQFTTAEFVGGVLMVVILGLLFRAFL